MYNLLICDDEKDIVNALKIYLSDPSYELYTPQATAKRLCALSKGKTYTSFLWT